MVVWRKSKKILNQINKSKPISRNLLLRIRNSEMINT